MKELNNGTLVFLIVHQLVLIIINKLTNTNKLVFHNSNFKKLLHISQPQLKPILSRPLQQFKARSGMTLPFKTIIRLRKAKCIITLKSNNQTKSYKSRLNKSLKQTTFFHFQNILNLAVETLQETKTKISMFCLKHQIMPRVCHSTLSSSLISQRHNLCQHKTSLQSLRGDEIQT